MSSLISIAKISISSAAPGDAAALAAHKIDALPVLVIFPHNQCNCRCVMCDIWRIRKAREITPANLDRQLDAIRKLGVRWVVFSGGEPQLNAQWSGLAQMLRSVGSRVTLLTAGLLLKPQAQVVAECIDDVIVSLDGPPAVHNAIRRIPGAFEQMAEGVKALHHLNPQMPVRARCTIQKANHHSLRAVVAYARQIGLASVSFLAADLTSEAFNRPEGWLPERRDRVGLSSDEVDALEVEIEQLILEQRILGQSIDEHQIDEERANRKSPFVVESAEKLRRIVQHFRAHLGQSKNIAPRCNAPWVSAVIEASGDVRPCFFHPVMGNIHAQTLPDILNSQEALQFRSGLDIANNDICRRCVCSLHISRQDNLATQ